MQQRRRKGKRRIKRERERERERERGREKLARVIKEKSREKHANSCVTRGEAGEYSREHRGWKNNNTGRQNCEKK